VYVRYHKDKKENMLALVGLFSAGMSLMACQVPYVAEMRGRAEMYCEGAIDCFDGCDICGFTMCEFPMEGALPICECDFWMCYAYCAKAKCEPVWAAQAAAECSAIVLAGGDEYAACGVNCNAAWTLSPLSALVLMLVRW